MNKEGNYRYTFQQHRNKMCFCNNFVQRVIGTQRFSNSCLDVVPSFLHRWLRIALFHFLCAAERIGVQYLSCWNLIFLIDPWGFVTYSNLCLVTSWVLQPCVLLLATVENAHYRRQSFIWFPREPLTVFPLLRKRLSLFFPSLCILASVKLS